MTTIAHGIGWLWMGVLLLAAAAWGLYLTWKALRCALPRMWHWLREAWARGCPTAWDEYRDPLAPMETLRQQLDRMAAEAERERREMEARWAAEEARIQAEHKQAVDALIAAAVASFEKKGAA